MTPTLHPRLLNGFADDPAVHVEAMHASAAALFDCGDIAALSTGHLLKIGLVCVSHTHMDHWSDLDRLTSRLSNANYADEASLSSALKPLLTSRLS